MSPQTVAASLMEMMQPVSLAKFVPKLVRFAWSCRSNKDLRAALANNNSYGGLPYIHGGVYAHAGSVGYQRFRSVVQAFSYLYQRCKRSGLRCTRSTASILLRSFFQRSCSRTCHETITYISRILRYLNGNQ